MKARIQFKAKKEPVTFAGDAAPSYYRVKVPVLDRKHCDMNAFRSHPNYGMYANSDLFKGMLKRIKADTFGGEYLRLDRIPEGVDADESGFLVVVTLYV